MESLSVVQIAGWRVFTVQTECGNRCFGLFFTEMRAFPAGMPVEGKRVPGGVIDRPKTFDQGVTSCFITRWFFSWWL